MKELFLLFQSVFSSIRFVFIISIRFQITFASKKTSSNFFTVIKYIFIHLLKAVTLHVAHYFYVYVSLIGKKQMAGSHSND